MDRCHINIAVAEPSDIIYDGLVSVLQKKGSHFYFYRVADLSELMRLCCEEEIKLAIINPTLVQNRESEFAKLKRCGKSMQLAAIIHSHFSAAFLSRFNIIIEITDSAGEICNKIERVIEECSCSFDERGELTERELDVLKLLLEGLSNKEVSERLFISVHTVISHRKNIVRKTGFKSLSVLAILVISKKLFPLNPS